MAAGTREEMADRTIAGRGASATDKGREGWGGAVGAVGGAKKKHHMLFACFGVLLGHGIYFLSLFFFFFFPSFFPSDV